jgi:Tfp pilus assembly protein FimT
MFQKSKSKNRKNEVGVSLIEIVIVLSVSLVLSAIALPNITGTMAVRHLNATVTMVSGKVMQARMTAIKRNKTTWLRISPTNRTVKLQTTDTAGNTIDLTPTANFSNQVSLAGSTDIDIAFDSMGRPTTGAQTINFTATGSKSKNITISSVGKTTMGNTL